MLTSPLSAVTAQFFRPSFWTKRLIRSLAWPHTEVTDCFQSSAPDEANEFRSTAAFPLKKHISPNKHLSSSELSALVFSLLAGNRTCLCMHLHIYSRFPGIKKVTVRWDGSFFFFFFLSSLEIMGSVMNSSALLRVLKLRFMTGWTPFVPYNWRNEMCGLKKRKKDLHPDVQLGSHTIWIETNIKLCRQWR